MAKKSAVQKVIDELLAQRVIVADRANNEIAALDAALNVLQAQLPKRTPEADSGAPHRHAAVK